MQSLSDVSPADFDAALTPSEVRTSMLIQIALGIGIALFMGVVLLLYAVSEPAASAPAPDTSVVRLLSLIHVALAAVLSIVAKVVDDMQFRPARLQRLLTHGGFPAAMASQSSPQPSQLCIYVIRAAMIIRLALYQGIALFGLVVCILCVVDDIVHTYPLYWLNILSSLWILVHIATTLPSRARIKTIFMSRIKRMPVS